MVKRYKNSSAKVGVDYWSKIQKKSLILKRFIINYIISDDRPIELQNLIIVIMVEEIIIENLQSHITEHTI